VSKSEISPPSSNDKRLRDAITIKLKECLEELGPKISEKDATELDSLELHQVLLENP
jgi:hypothetical protein